MSKTLVIGASGSVGSEIVKLLRAQGRSVRTTTSKRPSGADGVHVDLITGKGIREAFEGVDRVFLLSPAGYADQYAILAPLVHEAKRRGVSKVVLMTALGADANDAAPLRRSELDLERSGLPFNIIRPNWFMQNFQTFWIGSILEEGKIRLPAKRAKTSFIDTRDIAAVAAKLLITDEMNGRAFNLTGPEALDHDEVAAAISQATGKRITYEDIDPAVLRQGLLAAGLPADYAEFLLLILGFLAEGYNSAVTDEVKRILGRDPIPFAKYAASARQAWL